jgi:hypothetical protein
MNDVRMRGLSYAALAVDDRVLTFLCNGGENSSDLLYAPSK